MKRPTIEFNDARGIVTIEGVPYNYQFFHDLGVRGLDVGAIVEVMRRDEDGSVWLKRHEKPIAADAKVS
jgi:hypothetical protein